MSDLHRALVVGASGLVGRAVLDLSRRVDDVRVTGLARGEFDLPPGVQMELLLADPDGWARAVETIAPDAVICALGTTWAKAGRDEDAFRAVDERLVLSVARAAHKAGARSFVAVSAIGADANSRNFYLRVKGEVEQALHGIGFRRLDLLRPGLLRGNRQGDRRVLERVGIAAAPLTNALLHGKYRQYRAIRAETVALAALQCVRERARGRFAHDNEGMERLVVRLERALAID